jgi:hypothetical protein
MLSQFFPVQSQFFPADVLPSAGTVRAPIV